MGIDRRRWMKHLAGCATVAMTTAASHPPSIAQQPQANPFAAEPLTPTADARRQQIELLQALASAEDPRWLLGQNLGIADQATIGYRENVLGLQRFSTGQGLLPIVGVDYGWNVLQPRAIAQANQTLVEHAKRGGMVTVCMHPANPFTLQQPAVRQRRSESLWRLLEPKHSATKRWQKTVNVLADGLAFLKDQGVPVLFRPLHEANGDWFWWCPLALQQLPRKNRDDEVAAFRQLWQSLYDTLCIQRGMDHLIWVFASATGLGEEVDSVVDYRPEPTQFDVAGIDWYGGLQDLAALVNDPNMLEVSRWERPFGLCEFGPLQRLQPDPSASVVAEIIRLRPDICFINAWHSWTEVRGLQRVAWIDQPSPEDLLKLPHLIFARP
jgi:mannan endo-1,4-beta-mannosidase